MRNETPGISICHGVFTHDPTGFFQARDRAVLSVFAMNGDVLDIGLTANVSGLLKLTTPSDFAHTSMGLFVSWGGLVVDGASEDVVLTSGSGLDCRSAVDPIAAVPEPESDAMLLVGLGVLSLVRRLRQQSS